MEKVDFITTVNGNPILVEKVSKSDEQKEAAKLKGYADSFVKADSENG
ncbi:MAG: hypothetical protein IJK83_11545 [Clostridiales bacterium]|nr:hypothetical protein [Clostridiales bacterium]